MPTSLIRHESKCFHIRDLSGCENIIYEIGFVLHLHRSSSFAYQHSGHAECNRLYNGATILIIWFFNCILIMNRLQYRKNMLYVRASSAGAIAILVYRSKTFKTVKLLQSKENYVLLSFSFPWTLDCVTINQNSTIFFFCRFVNLSMI